MLKLLLATLPALLLQVSTEPPKIRDCGPGAERARTLRAAADMASRRHDWRRADRLIARALKILGTAYRQSTMIDDSETHLVLADIATRKGRFSEAASTRRRVLVDRLRLCAVTPAR